MTGICPSPPCRFPPCLAMLIILCLQLPNFAEEVDSAALANSTHRILFESYQDGNWDLWSIQADGADRTNVTATPDIHELYPQASPDGRHVCFLVDDQSSGQTQRSLWVMNADGSGRVKISDGARHACWSPDGQRIAFPKQEFAKFQLQDFVSKRLYFYDRATQQITVHPNESIEHIYVLTWSPNGQWIVATVHGGMGFGHAILALEVNGDRVIDLKIGGCRPCFNHDGSQLTWSVDDHTISVGNVAWTADGPEIVGTQVLYHHPTLHLYHPDFSPDGKFISFSMGPGGRFPASGPGTHTGIAEMVGVKAQWDLYAKSVGSHGEPIRLTHNPDWSNKESEWIALP